VFDPNPDVDKGYTHFMHLVFPDAMPKSCVNLFNPKNPMAAPECKESGVNSMIDICTNSLSGPICQHSFDNLYDDVFLDFDGSKNIESAGQRIGEVGGEYAPYILSRFTTGDFRSTTIYFMMSTWNPYQANLMKTTLRLERPPVAKAGSSQTVSVGADCTAQVHLDGTRSSDPDDDALTYTWTGPFGTVTGATPVVSLPLGASSITLKVDDGFPGGTASDTVVITAKDTTPPFVSSSLALPTLWPPNHDLASVGLAATVRDNCTVNPVVSVQGVFSTEADVGPDSDGNFSPDAQISGLVPCGCGRNVLMTGTGAPTSMSSELSTQPATLVPVAPP
jgi:hypothetical protein